MLATKPTCRIICNSYGIWTNVMPNLEVLEQIQLQKLNHFFYDIAVGRV